MHLPRRFSQTIRPVSASMARKRPRADVETPVGDNGRKLEQVAAAHDPLLLKRWPELDAGAVSNPLDVEPVGRPRRFVYLHSRDGFGRGGATGLHGCPGRGVGAGLVGRDELDGARSADILRLAAVPEPDSEGRPSGHECQSADCSKGDRSPRHVPLVRAAIVRTTMPSAPVRLRRSGKSRAAGRPPLPETGTYWPWGNETPLVPSSSSSR